MEKTKQQNGVIILRESLPASIIKDLVTFLMFISLMGFNHTVLSGNGWVDLAFILFMFMWLSSLKLSRVFTGTKQQAIEWLQQE